MAVTNTSGTVQGIFSLHVATAGLSFLLLLFAIWLFTTQLKNGPARPRTFMKFWRSSGKRHSAAGTHLFLLLGLFTLLIAYAAQSAIVALQTRILTSPFYITSAYSYPYYPGASSFSPNAYGKDISILSFLYQCAEILLQASINGAIWICANHLHSNGTQLREPGFLSVVLNVFWLVALLGLGFASWAVGMARRGSGQSARAYPTIVAEDYVVRTLFVTYVVVVVASSSSVTLESVLCWIGVKKNGVPGNTKFKSALTRLAMLITPVVWARNAFSIAQIVIIYYNNNAWSQTTNRALAFLFIIFGQLCDLAILALLLMGAWSFGRKDEGPYVVKDARYSESVAARDSLGAEGNNRGPGY